MRTQEMLEARAADEREVLTHSVGHAATMTLMALRAQLTAEERRGERSASDKAADHKAWMALSDAMDTVNEVMERLPDRGVIDGLVVDALTRLAEQYEGKS